MKADVGGAFRNPTQLHAEVERLKHSLAAATRELRELRISLKDVATSRIKIEQAHQEWMQSVDAVHQPMMIHDAKFRILRCNRAYAERTGRSFRDLIGKPYWNFFPRGTGPLPGCKAAVELTSGGEQGKNHQEQFTLDTGEIFISRSFPIRDASRRFVQALHIFQDVTEASRKEENLRQLTERLTEAQRLARIGNWEMDRDTGTVTWSEEVYRIFGRDPASPVPGMEERILAEESDARLRHAISETLRSGVPYELDLEFVHADGSTRWITARGAVKHNPQGMVTGLRGTVQEITERKLLEEIEKKRIRRVDAQAEALATASSSAALYAGDVPGFARQITELAARVTGVERANAWLFNDDETELYCVDLYEATPERHSQGMLLSQRQFQNEFQALKSAAYVNADDPLSDPRTAGYVDVYLKPLGITSMLDALVQISGRNLGLLCLEHVGKAHHWKRDEITFACRLADKLALAIVNRDRVSAQEAMLESEDRNRVLFATSKDGFMTLAGENWLFESANPSALAMFGARDEAELMQKTPWELSPIRQPDGSISTEKAKEMIAIAMREGNHFFDWTHRRLDGTEFPATVLLTRLTVKGHTFLNATVRDITERRKAEESLQKLNRVMASTVEALATTVEKRDPYTAGHQRRVAILAAAIGREMGLDEDRIAGVHFAAIIHDIGKIYVPAEILSRPGKIRPVEMEIIKSHCQVGHDIVQGVEFPWPVAQIILQHHERMDGSGYPQGLKGEEIILEARIVTVADVVEAMSSHRPYRPAVGTDAALAEISRNRGRYYDPQVVDACIHLISEKGFAFPD